jgi:hypothetical protein
MPEPLHINVGETRQLRPPSEGVGRWTSSAPTVASTTDEDLVTNRPGGLVTALKPGRARITAFGYDDKTKVLELDIEVAAAQESAAIRVEKGKVADLPHVAGVTRWTLANPRVAEITEDGRVRGISPGITYARGQGGVTTECAIEVTGSMDAEVGQSVRLAEFFATPVKSWRTSCPNEVEIDAQGTVATGDRPRTVEVSVELASGRTFTFNLRIMGASAQRAAPPIRAATGESRLVPPTPPLPEAVLPETSTPPRPDQRQIVESLLAEAEARIAMDDWIAAGARITAARLAAAADPELSRHVEQINERLRAGVDQRVGVMVVNAARMIAEGRYEEARRHLDSVRVPRDSASVVEDLRRLALLSEQFDSDAGDQVRDDVERQVEVVWGGVVRMRIPAALPALAEMSLRYGARIVPLLLDALCNSSLAGMPVAVRQSLGGFLGDAGTSAVEAAIAKLADENTSPAMVSELLNLSPDLKLDKQAACVVKFYRHAGVATQARLVERMAALHTNAAGVLFDLLAGVLKCMPPDRSLAKAIQARIRAESGAKRDELETKAGIWAGRGDRNAQTVLQQLYDYDAKAFRR